MNPESQQQSKWGKVGKVAIIFFVVLLCIAGIAYSYTDVGPAAASYEKNRQAAVIAGAAFNKESAAPLYNVPADDNAAPIIAEALKSIEPFEKQLGDMKLSDQDFMKIWKKLEAFFPAIEKGCQKNHLLFSHDQSTSEYVGTPEFVWIRYWIRAINRRTKIAAESNEPELARRILLTAAKLNAGVSDYPEIDALTFRLTNATILNQALQEAFRIQGDQPQWQSLISDTLKILDKPYDLRPALKREHWSAVSLVKIYLGKEPDPNNSLGETGFEVKLVRLIPRIEKALLSRVHEYYALAIASYPHDPSDYQAVDRLFKQLGTISDRPGLNTVFPYYYYLFQGTGSILPLVAERAQRYALAQALEIVRQKRNPADRLPLSGRYALDIDGKPLRVKKSALGWIIYSIGRDKVDDGGTDMFRSKGDFVIHLPKTQ